jgi:HEAT repeat protein
VQEIVLSPPAGVDDGLLSQLALAIKDGIRDKMAIPALEQLLAARDVRFRRAAASALRHMAVEATIGPLAKALEDADREVRYNGVLGLAVITKQSEFGPAYDQFERDEGRYLSFWREWLKRR